MKSPDEVRWENELFNTLLRDYIRNQLDETDEIEAIALGWINDNPTFGAPK